MFESVVFAVGALAVSALLVLSLAGLLLDGFQFWPPPNKHSWQYKTFWLLFRIFILAVLVVSAMDFHQRGTPPLLQSLLGWLLAVLGFGLATAISMRLGWQNAHGEANGLKTNGWFSVSRNPIYVASIIGMVGLSLAINSVLLGILLLLWALMYVLAPFAEEPWLLEQYGPAYKQYCEKVPRFVGWRG